MGAITIFEYHALAIERDDSVLSQTVKIALTYNERMARLLGHVGPSIY